MEQGEKSTQTFANDNNEGEEGEGEGEGEESHVPSGLTPEEFQALKPIIDAHHTYDMSLGQCYSILAQRIDSPVDRVWSVVRRFDAPQVYKHFIRNCCLKSSEMTVGCLREVNVISGLPANTSTERLDILNDSQHVTGFSIIGGEHRLRNYRSVTTASEFSGVDGKIWTVVLESYVVDVPEGNTEDDTRMFADTVVRLNLQKLKSVVESRGRPHPFTNWESQQMHTHPKNQELHNESDGPFAWRKGVRKLTTCKQGVEKTKGSQAYKVRLLRKMHYPQRKKRKLGGLSQQHCFPSCIYFLR